MSKTLFYPVLIVYIGLLMYSNSLFTSFVWDDQYQIVENSYVHSPEFIPLYFVSVIKDVEKKGILLDFYYKPLLFSAYSILYMIGNGTPYVFHLFQAEIHIINTMLLFYLLKKFMKQNLAFILAFIFLVHPANQGTVVYIATLQDVLFFFFGISALLLFIYKPFKDLNLLRIASLSLLFSLLSKETGILFVGICFLYIIFFEKKMLAKASIFLSFLLILYSILRVSASNLQLFQIIRSEVMGMSLLERITLIPTLYLYYLKEIFIPSDDINLAAKLITRISLRQEIIFVIGTLSSVFIAFMAIRYVWKSKYFYQALFFLIWFCIGLGMHLQIFPLDALVARRWLYFPMVGFLGFLGVLITKLNIKSKAGSYLLFSLFLLIIGWFSIQTFRMNSYW